MEKIATKSSNIASISRTDDGVEVEFKSGTAYRYIVPDEVWDEIVDLDEYVKSGKAVSWGKWFNKNIKSSYEGKKVR